jgi:hypothetical protein
MGSSFLSVSLNKLLLQQGLHHSLISKVTTKRRLLKNQVAGIPRVQYMGSLSSSVMLSPAGTISPTASPTALTKIQTQISTLKTIFLFTIVGLWVTMANNTSLLERGALNGRVQLIFGDTGIFGGESFNIFFVRLPLKALMWYCGGDAPRFYNRCVSVTCNPCAHGCLQLLKVAYGDDPPASIGPHVRKNLACTNPPFENGLQCWRDLLGKWDSYIFSRG